MSKILNRKMFSFPKQNHQGTGIVSGLEYRPGYRVGGRVGLTNGGETYNNSSSKKTLLAAIRLRELPGAYGEPIEYFKKLDNSDLLDILRQYDQSYAQGGRIGLKHGGPHGSPMPAGFVGGLGTGEVIPQTSAKLPSSTLDLNEILNQAKVMGKNFSIKPRDLSVFEPTAVDPIDYSKYSTDASKYLTDYNKYRPTTMDAIGKTAADTIEELEVIPGGTLGKKSTVATFAKNFQRNAASTKERRQELDLMKTKEKNAAKKLNDDQLMTLQIKTDEDARSIQALNKKEQKEYMKMQMDEIRDSDIANKSAVMELYQDGVNSALKEIEFGFEKQQFEEQLKLDKQVVAGKLAQLEKETPNVWTYVTGMVEASGIDIKNPASWSKEDMKEIKNFMAYGTGEKSEEGIAADMASQKAKIVSSAFNSLGDDQQRKILNNKSGEMQQFFDTLNPLLSVAGVEEMSGMPDLKINEAYMNLLQNSGQVSSLLSSKGLQNPLAQRNDLYTLASANEDVVFILDGLQKAFAALAEGRITKEDLQEKINIANTAFAQIDSSIAPIQ